jgi:hypothetical protein
MRAATRRLAATARGPRRLGAAVSLGLCALLASCGPAPNAPREEFIVPKRATLRAVADTLAAARPSAS